MFSMNMQEIVEIFSKSNSIFVELILFWKKCSIL
jgi:hypothetical protein